MLAFEYAPITTPRRSPPPEISRRQQPVAARSSEGEEKEEEDALLRWLSKVSADDVLLEKVTIGETQSGCRGLINERVLSPGEVVISCTFQFVFSVDAIKGVDDLELTWSSSLGIKLLEARADKKSK